MMVRWLIILAAAVVAFAALWLGAHSAHPAEVTLREPIMVDVKRRTTDKEWVQRETRVLAHLADYRREGHVELSTYGGLKAVRVEPTGFFHARELDGRWWLVDPDGYLFLTVGVCSVRMNPTEGGQAALAEKFGSAEGWAEKTTEQLWALGYNTLGCWSGTEDFASTSPRLPYTTQSNFMSSYGKLRGGTYQKPGHTGYPSDCVFVFDPEFEEFCRKHAEERLAATRDDPYLFGHFSDNEMPFPDDALDRYLKLEESDPGHKAASEWIEEHNVTPGENGFGAEARAAFLEHMAERYYRIVNAAIKSVDPNHLYLGSRLHGGDLRKPSVFRAAGRHVDAVAVNYYGAWTPDPQRMSAWVEWSGKPFFITEWYAKGMDSGMGNITGAGWTVKTQADRGRFYQNFTLGLLAHPGCVGWHWFKYMDNDPTNMATDPSNRDSNKGFVGNTYEPWEPLVEAMRELNHQAYPLRYYFARQ